MTTSNRAALHGTGVEESSGDRPAIPEPCAYVLTEDDWTRYVAAIDAVAAFVAPIDRVCNPDSPHCRWPDRIQEIGRSTVAGLVSRNPVLAVHAFVGSRIVDDLDPSGG